MRKDFIFRATVFLLFVTLVVIILFYGRVFLLPIIIAVLLAIVLLPMNRKMESWGFPRVLAILLSLLLLLTLVSGILFLFYTQVSSFYGEMPTFRVKVLEKFETIRTLIEDKTSISGKEQMNWLQNTYSDFIHSSGKYLSMLLMGLSSALATLSIILVYILFFLLYRGRIKTFILKLVPEANHEKAICIISNTVDLIQHYLIGLLIELVVLGTLNAIGLLVIGVRQAIFFGYLAGMLNIIPYIGTLVGSLFPIIMALIFKDSFSAVIAVAGVMAFNQFIDNNFLTPKIIGSHVRLNPLVTIMGIIAGGLIWGVAGMILFIPLLGVVKIICDNIEALEPFGYLLGEDESSGPKFNFLKKIFSRK